MSRKRGAPVQPKSSLEKEWIAILDFGSQYAQLIARRVRELGVYSEILRHDISAPEIAARAPSGIILSGGPFGVLDPDAPDCDPGLFESGIPILGICYGMQLIAKALGGTVVSGSRREYGSAEIRMRARHPLFRDMPDYMRVWMSHGDHIAVVPPGFAVLAETADHAAAAFGNDAGKIYGLQFHPEVVHTPEGSAVLKVFLLDICRCAGDWKISRFVEETIRGLREKIGCDHVVCGLSGGVDSSVVSILLQKAVPGCVHCIFVDNGLLRHGEAEEIKRIFEGEFGLNLRVVDAGRLFLERLKGITDPEEKRRIIGAAFIEVFSEEARKLGGIKYLAQGTLYPDVIESASPAGGPSTTIKSHHNVGGLPDILSFELIEPLRELFKDEVRAAGRELELPDRIINRRPFPGPGLAVRILGEVTEEKLDLLRRADLIVQEEIDGYADSANMDSTKIWQSFAVLLPVRTVGVMGDARTYESVAALRVVESSDGMTADWTRLPYDILARISNRIINEVPGINRVVYDISSKPPATIEWE